MRICPDRIPLVEFVQLLRPGDRYIVTIKKVFRMNFEGQFLNPPMIVPIPIETPVPKPPRELSKYHFPDPGFFNPG